MSNGNALDKTFTDEAGYAWKLTMYPNGSYGTTGHISMFMAIESGPNDSKLQWPIYGRVFYAFLKVDNFIISVSHSWLR